MNIQLGIVKDQIVLDDRHVPEEIIGREEQLKKLMFCLTPACKGQKPIHAWLYGETGTGKTLVARHALERLRVEARVAGSYINCWKDSTLYSALEKIVGDLRLLMAERVSASFKVDTLEKQLERRPYIVVLDEIDQPCPRERDAILYNLCGIGNVGLVCICNSRRTLFDIENRVKSRLSPVQIEFPEYSKQHMIRILHDRARLALNKSAWNNAAAEKIASLASGDARVAIHTLRNAARSAELDKSHVVRDEHILDGHHSARTLRRTYLLDRLTEDYRILYKIVDKRGQLESGALWHGYLARCARLRRPPIALRTFSEYMNRLADWGLVSIDRAPVKGNVRLFKVNQ